MFSIISFATEVAGLVVGCIGIYLWWKTEKSNDDDKKDDQNK